MKLFLYVIYIHRSSASPVASRHTPKGSGRSTPEHAVPVDKGITLGEHIDQIIIQDYTRKQLYSGL